LSGEAGGGTPARVPRGHNYDAVAELVAARIEKTQGRISAKRRLPQARTVGCAGSARNFRRLVASAKQAWRAEHHRGRPAVWSPGEMPVIDWGSLGAGRTCSVQCRPGRGCGSFGQAVSNSTHSTRDAPESLWSTFKHEEHCRHVYATKTELVAAVDNWIRDYDTDRRHSAIGMLSPDNYEKSIRAVV